MAKYAITRKINEKESIEVTQCASFDEAFKILDKGEHELKLMHEHNAKIKLEEEAKKNEVPPVLETPPTPPADVPVSNTPPTGEGTPNPESTTDVNPPPAGGVDADGNPNPPVA